jgi:3-deoxy-7-phosphoheptulonate synthase
MTHIKARARMGQGENMLVLMESTASETDIRAVVELLEGVGVRAQVQEHPGSISILAPHASQALKADRLEPMAGVRKVVPITSPFKLASADAAPGPTIVRVRDVAIGGGELTLVAGPCGVESREQLFTVARYVADQGVKLLRAGAFKPRTSPYSFQGLGLEGLRLLEEVRAEFNLGIVTEATEIEVFDDVERSADLIQIGARNMQNFALLKRAGRSEKPVLLKRGPSATLEEWLYAAEYILGEGNRNVVPAAKALTHLPVMVDPSHATGRRDLVIPCARAAVAIGADGLLVETHCQPEKALSDGPQALLPSDFVQLVDQCGRVREALQAHSLPGGWAI